MRSFLACLLVPFLARAAAVDLSGKVHDNLGRPVFRATVALAHGGISTITLPDGSWRIAGDLPARAADSGIPDSLVYSWNGEVQARVPVPADTQSEIGQMMVVAASARPEAAPSPSEAPPVVAPGTPAAPGSSAAGFRGALNGGYFLGGDPLTYTIAAGGGAGFLTRDGRTGVELLLGWEHSSYSKTVSGYGSSSSVSGSSDGVLFGLVSRSAVFAKLLYWTVSVNVREDVFSSTTTRSTGYVSDYLSDGKRSEWFSGTNLVTEDGFGLMFCRWVGMEVDVRWHLLPYSSLPQAGLLLRVLI